MSYLHPDVQARREAENIKERTHLDSLSADRPYRRGPESGVASKRLEVRI